MKLRKNSIQLSGLLSLVVVICSCGEKPSSASDDKSGTSVRSHETGITYIDAVEGESGNTFATGKDPKDTSWLGVRNGSKTNEWWYPRIARMNNSDAFESAYGGAVNIPELTTQIRGLEDGYYIIWAFYWDQLSSDIQNWTLSAGLSSGDLKSYSSPGEPAVNGAVSTMVFEASTLKFANSVVTSPNKGSRQEVRMFGVKLGGVAVFGGLPVDVFIGNNIGSHSMSRTLYDGVGYELVP